MRYPFPQWARAKKTRDREGKSGSSGDIVRLAWKMRFGLSEKKAKISLHTEGCRQLSQCTSDEARRLLLGVSR